jgi:hypothetical protein
VDCCPTNSKVLPVNMPGHIKSGHVKKKKLKFGLTDFVSQFFLGGGKGEGTSQNFFDLSSYTLQKMVFINFYLRHPTVLVQIIKWLFVLFTQLLYYIIKCSYKF